MTLKDRYWFGGFSGTPPVGTKSEYPPPPPGLAGGGGAAMSRQPWKRLSSVTKKIRSAEHHHYKFFGGFCRFGDHHFQNFFNFNPFIASHGRLSPNAKRSAAPRVSGRSGDSQFYARNGSSSFRSPRIFTLKTVKARSGAPAFSSSKRLKLVPEAHIFTLDREFVPEPLSILHFCRGTYLYQNLGVSTPPPPSPGCDQWWICWRMEMCIKGPGKRNNPTNHNYKKREANLEYL